MTTITAHGASITVTSDGVRVERTAMGQTLLPADLEFPVSDLRGWYCHAPSATSPGWIQFSLADPPVDAVARPVRGYPALHGVANVVAFAPGQGEDFLAVDSALTALQAGYPPEDAASPSGFPSESLSAAPSPSPSRSDALALFNLPTAPSATPEPPVTPAGRTGSSGARRQSGWRRISTPDTVPEPDLTADADGPVFGQQVTVTGDFEPYEKGEVWDMIAAAGGTVGKNVTKKTTLLVLGTWDSVTSKEKRARELKNKGQDIEIWTFAELLAALGKAPRPDFSEVKGTDAPF